jgi:hypothetical protein
MLAGIIGRNLNENRPFLLDSSRKIADDLGLRRVYSFPRDTAIIYVSQRGEMECLDRVGNHGMDFPA